MESMVNLFYCKMKIYENKRYISLKNKHYQTEECYFRKYCTLLCKSYSTAKLLQLKVATNAWKKTYWDPIFGRLHFFLASFDCYQFFTSSFSKFDCYILFLLIEGEIDWGVSVSLKFMYIWVIYLKNLKNLKILVQMLSFYYIQFLELK